jgi:4-amino-4-deoxy-L-arabinose transferase-like glycosyltransferase
MPRSVWVIAVAVDELYFLAAGRRLAWGFVDQPPLTPLLARAADLLPGPINPTILRIGPAFSAAGVVALTAAMAQRFGATNRATITAAAFAGVGGFFLAVGHLLSTATFEVLIVAAIMVVVISLIDGADARWWLVVGTLFGVGMLNKNTIAGIAVGLLIGLVTTPQRTVLKTHWFWVGGVISLAIALPNLIWQAANGWPQFEMAATLAKKSDGPIDYLLIQVAVLSVFLVIPAVAGSRWLWSDPFGSRWRALVIAFASLFVVFLLTGGKGYYVAALYLPLLAAGAIVLEQTKRRTRNMVIGLVAIGAVVGLPLALPLLPPQHVEPFNEINGELGETYAWDQFVDQVGTVYLELDTNAQATAAIFTSNYGQAGAIEILASDRLPQPVSGHNSYSDWGAGQRHGAIIGVGYRPTAIVGICPEIETAAVITNAAELPNDELGTEVWVCSEPSAQLASIWDDLRHLD